MNSGAFVNLSAHSKLDSAVCLQTRMQNSLSGKLQLRELNDAHSKLESAVCLQTRMRNSLSGKLQLRQLNNAAASAE